MYNVGIVGLGVGEAHIPGFQAHPATTVKSVCDFAEDKLKSVGQKHGDLKLCKNADEILLDPSIQIVSIASYDSYHFEQIMKALEKGKHVFVEKPICLEEKHAKEIRQALKKNKNLKLSSNLLLRQSPRFKAIKKLVEAGKFGQLYYMEGDYNYGRLHKITEGWRGKLDFYSVTHGGGIHMVDLLLWLKQKQVLEVAAFGNNISSKGSQFKFNDFVAAIMTFEDGSTAKVSSNFACVHPHFHCLNLYGTEATFKNDFEEGLLWKSRDPKIAPDKITEPYPGIEKDALIYDFVESIEKDREPIVKINEIFDSMSVCFAIEKAMHSNEKVKVEYI